MKEKFALGQEINWNKEQARSLMESNYFGLGAGPFKVKEIKDVSKESEEKLGHSQFIQLSKDMSIPGAGVFEVVWDKFNHQWVQPENISIGEGIIPTVFSGAFFEPAIETIKK